MKADEANSKMNARRKELLSESNVRAMMKKVHNQIHVFIQRGESHVNITFKDVLLPALQEGYLSRAARAIIMRTLEQGGYMVKPHSEKDPAGCVVSWKADHIRREEDDGE